MAYSAISGNGPRRVRRIIVADDDAHVRKVASRLIKLLGYDVMEAENGFQAVDIYRENMDSIDALLLDVRMPVMDGVEAFKEIRRMNPRVKVVFYSGDTGRARATELMEAGAAGFINKPFNLKVLSQTLEKAVNEQ